nr:importin beta-related nuclear transport receptor [Cryptomonas sp.]
MQNIFLKNESDIKLLENINFTISLLFSSNNTKESWEAQKFLTDFQSKMDSYKHVPLIIESNNPNVVYFGLQILERTVIYNWQKISREERSFLQNFVTDLIFDFTSGYNEKKLNLLNIRKLNLILVKIIIQEAESVFIFLKDLIFSSKISEQICENNLNIILMFFDEIYSVSDYRFSIIFQKNNSLFTNILKEMEFLCYFIFMQFDILSDEKKSLITVALNVFEKIIIIAPSIYNIEEFFLESFMFLCTKNNIRNLIMRCLTETVNSSNILSTLLISKVIRFFIIQFQEIIPVSKDLVLFFNQSEPDLREFIMNGAIFFLSFLKNCSIFFKSNPSFFGFFVLINQFMIKISCVPELEIFKICIDWWKIVVQKIQNNELLSLYDFSNFIPFIDLKKIMIGRMVKPEEVLIIEDENGLIIREVTRDTESIALYYKEKDILIYLAKSDEQYVRQIILEKLSFQFNKNTWNRATLNSLCWSIGSISEVFKFESEKHFIVAVIKDLLCLAEIKKGKDNKAIIASNIMYIVGQYPRFLRNHWKFLKTVIYKLFEFMHETHPGVQDMASDTFLKITKTCSNSIFSIQDGETSPFLDEILNSIDKITNSLEFHHIQQFYEGIGVVIKNVNNPDISSFYVSKLFEIINNLWYSLFKKKLIQEDVDCLEKVINLIKLNKKIASILEEKYHLYVKVLYSELNCFFTWSCDRIFQLLSPINMNSSNNQIIRLLKNIRNEILNLIECYVKIYFTPIYNEQTSKQLNQIIEPILDKYKISLYLKTGELELIQFCNVLLIECEFFVKVETIVIVFENIFKPTLELIKLDFESCPDIRKSFFFLIKSLVSKYFSFLFKLSIDSKKAEENFETIVQAVIWGLKHPDSSISRLSLKILLIIIEQITISNIGEYFYPKFISQLLVDLLAIMIDGLHTSTLRLQCKIFFHLVNQSKIVVNKKYLKEYIEIIFEKAFPDFNFKLTKDTKLDFLSHETFSETEEEFKKLIKAKNVVWENDSSSGDQT